MALAQKLAANSVQANARIKEKATRALQELTDGIMKEFAARCEAQSTAGRTSCVWQTGCNNIEGLIGPEITPEVICKNAKIMLERKLMEELGRNAQFRVQYYFGEIQSKQVPQLHWSCKFEIAADWTQQKLQHTRCQEADRMRLQRGSVTDCKPIEFPEFCQLAGKLGLEPVAFLKQMETWMKFINYYKIDSGRVFAKNSEPSLKDSKAPDVFIVKGGDGYSVEEVDAEGKTIQPVAKCTKSENKAIDFTIEWVRYKEACWGSRNLDYASRERYARLVY